MSVPRPGATFRRDFERLRQQRVSRENRDAFAKHFMIGELATAIIVIIHRGQIIVNEGIRMDALDRASQRHGFPFVPAARGGGGQA